MATLAPPLLQASRNSPMIGSSTPRLGQKWGYFEAGADDMAATPGKKDNWQEIQIATFKNWVNDRLSSSKSNYNGPIVADMRQDFRDGVAIVMLLESLSGKRIRGLVKNPKFAAQKIANLQLAFNFMKSEDVKLVAIGKLYLNSTCRIFLKLLNFNAE